MVKNDEEKNLHAGHRGRLADLVYNAGIDNVSEIQALEFILFYVFPRGDVNPLAHRLLNKFGSVADVLDADPLELQSVNGIGPRAAKLISLIPEIFQYYTNCRLGEKTLVGEWANLFDYSEQLLRFKNVEEFYIVGVDASQKIKARRKLASGTINMVGIPPLEISKFLASTHSAMVFITHNHPGGSAKPSKQDIAATDFFKNICETLGVIYLDHVIVGANGIYSFKHNSIVREFFN